MSRPGVEPELVEAIARRVVELLRAEESQEQPVRLVDAATLARELGVERDWVYAHAEDLGAIRLGGRGDGSDSTGTRSASGSTPQTPLHREHRGPQRQGTDGGDPRPAEVGPAFRMAQR